MEVKEIQLVARMVPVSVIQDEHTGGVDGSKRNSSLKGTQSNKKGLFFSLVSMHTYTDAEKQSQNLHILRFSFNLVVHILKTVTVYNYNMHNIIIDTK